MLSKFIEFQLYQDEDWEKSYKQDKEFISEDKIKHFLIFEEKTYIIQMKAILASEKLCNELSLETNEQSLNLKLKYCKDERSFDYFMQMLYGNPSVKVPLAFASDIITTCLELGLVIYSKFSNN